ncbi:MAG: heme NO-binding domain-containing protein [Gemmatimonadetes bacterium]|nr:heme NO-binding domain-containing protein [Gemmatimonadota bacterium]
MKGIVFTEFIEMVEDVFGPDTADEIIDGCDLPNGGAYTAVGTYDSRELLALVTALGKATSTSVPDLVQAYGKHLLTRFVVSYPDFFEGVESTFDFLESVETHIHVEARKLYPDAEPPRFTCERDGDHTLSMVYESTRPFADLAEGLMLGCFEHFDEDVTIEREDLRVDEGSRVRFVLRKAA